MWSVGRPHQILVPVFPLGPPGSTCFGPTSYSLGPLDISFSFMVAPALFLSRSHLPCFSRPRTITRVTNYCCTPPRVAENWTQMLHAASQVSACIPGSGSMRTLCEASLSVFADNVMPDCQ